VSEPARPVAHAEIKRDPAPSPAEPKRDATLPRPTVSAWVIQLGAMDDEGKAKEMLSDARSRSGRALAHAAPFTEKVVHAGTTLYRARFSGFSESDEAQDACRAIKRSGFNCFATRS
jgi:D-alanyl-D-alanine carboxypeptidase